MHRTGKVKMHGAGKAFLNYTAKSLLVLKMNMDSQKWKTDNYASSSLS